MSIAPETAPLRERDGLTYPFEKRPELGEALPVAPGVFWVRMKLPFALAHINVWLLADGDGWAIVDTGINDQMTKQAWEDIFAKYLDGKPVTRVFVTHLHPDHVGLAGWLVERWRAPLHMSRTDYLLCRTLVSDTGREPPHEGLDFYRAAGFPEDAIRKYIERFGGFGSGVFRLPQAFHRLMDGQSYTIGGRQWRIVVGRGHAPEHACLWCPELKVIISGDQILPRISSNVSVFPTEPESNPLQEWLDSCAHFKELLPEDTLVLPAHNEPFFGVKKRLQALIDGHEEGMQKLLDLCATSKRAVDVFPALFRARITASNYLMATGESVAHLNCLLARGHIRRTRGADGADRYERV
jgi:glyoxylase-like metal-dependent hydrolase (beta-lactamase superfamily II)